MFWLTIQVFPTIQIHILEFKTHITHAETPLVVSSGLPIFFFLLKCVFAFSVHFYSLFFLSNGATKRFRIAS